MAARLALTLASVLLAIAVALGAFGAHALRSRLALIAGWLALAWAAGRAT